MYVGLNVGRDRTVKAAEDQLLPHQRRISEEPLIIVADAVFSPAECDAILAQDVAFEHAEG